MKKDDAISIIRVSAMIMIVIFHCFCYNAGIWGIGNPIYHSRFIAVIKDFSYVGLNLFVLISGLLFSRIEATGKYNDTLKFIINKFKRLLIPYLVWGILLCIIFKGLENPINIFYGISHLWFLLMLFEVFTITILTRFIWKRQNIKKSIMILLVFVLFYEFITKLNIMFNIPINKSLLGIQKTSCYLPVFYTGMLVEKFKIYKWFRLNKFVTLIIIFICFFVTLLTCYKTYSFSRLYQWFPPFALFVFAYIFLRDYQIRKHKEKFFITLLDKYSLSIYIIHHILIFMCVYYVNDFKLMMHSHPFFSPLVMFITVFLLSFLISVVLSYLPGAKYIIGTKGNDLKYFRQKDLP